MKCPHCQTEFFENWLKTQLSYSRQNAIMKGGPGDGSPFDAYTLAATCPNCLGSTFNFIIEASNTTDKFYVSQIYPRGGKFAPPPFEVPAQIASDYIEANEVLPISSKASAALSRRCLQAVLSAQGYAGRDLVKQVEAAINESDPSKALPLALRENIDAIRNFGNFSAHPITDQTTLQIVEVEEGEAEWCLQLLLDLFEHYYVAPARAAAKRAALAAKLAKAGKPPMKQ
jgi:hypothetical protein